MIFIPIFEANAKTNTTGDPNENFDPQFGIRGIGWSNRRWPPHNNELKVKKDKIFGKKKKKKKRKGDVSLTWCGRAGAGGLHVPLGEFAGGANDAALDQGVAEAGNGDGGDGDIVPQVEPGPAPDVEQIHDGYDEEAEDVEGEAEVDAKARGGAVSAVEDDEEEGEEAEEHVADGEDAVDVGAGVEVGEVVDGGDEGVPWEEEAGAQDKVNGVSEEEGVLRRLPGAAAVALEEELLPLLIVFSGTADSATAGETHPPHPNHEVDTCACACVCVLTCWLFQLRESLDGQSDEIITSPSETSH